MKHTFILSEAHTEPEQKGGDYTLYNSTDK